MDGIATPKCNDLIVIPMRERFKEHVKNFKNCSHTQVQP
jgi:hypothetical protein